MKKYLVRFILVQVSLVISLLSFSQGQMTAEGKRNLHKANKLMHEQSYFNAIALYTDLQSKYPQSEEVAYKLGLAYFITRDYKTSSKVFSSYISNFQTPKFPDAYYYMGVSLKSMGEYEKAISAFKSYQDAKGKKVFLKLVQNELNSALWASASVQNDDSTGHHLHRILGNMNRAYSDFSPLPLNKDTLIFASLQKDSIITYTHDDHHFHSVKLYEITKKDSLSWSEPTELDGYNSAYEHSANGVLSPDGKYFYFTRCVPNRSNKIVCRVCVTENDADKSKQHKIKTVDGINENGFSATQPTFQVIKKTDKNGKVSDQVIMYFVSDRPGGRGGKDIWYAIMNHHGKFGNPVNCGSTINTVGDEVSPNFVQKEGILYFSSNFHFGFGGFDIFKSTGEMKTWTKPENMSFPINTSYDDTYFTPLKNIMEPENEGYLVSNRPGGVALHNETCCDDIYVFHKSEAQKVEFSGLIAERILTNADTLAKDSLAKPVYKKRAAKNVIVGVMNRKVYENYLRNSDTSLASLGQDIQWITSSDSTGKFVGSVDKGKQYVVILKSEKHISKIINTRAMLIQDTLIVDKRLDTIQTNEVEKEKLTADLDLSKVNIHEKTFVLDNVYFDTRKDDIRKDALPALELLHKFMINNRKVKIELSGHTDSRGDKEYNLDLSQRRAEAIVAYLVQKGIDENKLVAKGYGEDMPIAPNENPDGSDNPEGRAKNRRTEVKILHK